MENHEHDADDDLKKVFKIFDKDHNGFITADELKSAMEMLNEKANDEEINDMIREADLNHDGQVNFEGFLVFFVMFINFNLLIGNFNFSFLRICQNDETKMNTKKHSFCYNCILFHYIYHYKLYFIHLRFVFQ